MKFEKLGRSGLIVSRLCLGTMNFGDHISEEDSFSLMDEALNAGINFFDTADTYGWEAHPGWSEEIIGKWFAQGNGRREKTVLATKVYNPIWDINDGPNGGKGLSAYKIIRHVESSLKRLRTDHIELYQMHHIDRSVMWEEIWDAFDILKKQGKIVYVGSSNFAGWDLVKAQAKAEKLGSFGLVSEQHKYNLLCRLPELEVLPAARDLGIGVIAWSPLYYGMLGGNQLNADIKRRTNGAKNLIDEHKAKLEAFSSLCKEIGEKEANVSLAWLLANPAITGPIIGPRTIEQLTSSLRSVDIVLTEDVMKAIDEIFPGPGGAAPEAYAW